MIIMTLNIEKICLERGLKMTEQRRVIARAIASSADHPCVEEVYLRANAIDQRISLATVYRAINLLESYGIIEKLEFGEGKARYEFKKNENEQHYHLINIITGEIIEFYDEELDALREKIALKLGYKLVGHRIQLFGTPKKNGE